MFFFYSFMYGMNKSFLFLVPLQNSEAAARLLIYFTFCELS